MTEHEIKKMTGDLILESQRIKLRAEGMLKEREEMSSAQALLSIIVWFILIILTVAVLANDAHALDCSFYSVESLKKEGTWK